MGGGGGGEESKGRSKRPSRRPSEQTDRYGNEVSGMGGCRRAGVREGWGNGGQR